jgi:hypothetical protein
MGHCWWYSRGVLEVFPQLLTEFYDVKTQGHAPHPKRGADWRPPPIVAKYADGEWNARLEDNTRYRVIAKVEGAWKQLHNDVNGTQFGLGDPNRKYEAVELLVQRR